METPCKQPGEVTKSSSTVLNRKPKQDCSKYGLTGSRLIPFAHIIQLLCFELHKARQQECFRNELYSFVQCLIPRTQQNSSIGEWTFVLQCLSCQDSAASKIWVEVYVWNAEFQSIVLHNKFVFEIINCPLLSCFWALMAYYLTIQYWCWCTFLWTS